MLQVWRLRDDSDDGGADDGNGWERRDECMTEEMEGMFIYYYYYFNLKIIKEIREYEKKINNDKIVIVCQYGWNM